MSNPLAPQIHFASKRRCIQDARIPPGSASSRGPGCRRLGCANVGRNANSFWPNDEVVVDSVVDTVDSWEKIRLMRRQQDLAVAEENYKRAAELRDSLKSALDRLSPMKQFVLHQVDLLSSPEKEEKREAIRRLGASGFDFAIPDLAILLQDKEFHLDAQQAMLQIFSRSENEESNNLMQMGESMLLQKGRDLDASLEVFDLLIKNEPSFAEGFNKRATVLYLMQKYEESIKDCKLVLQLQPYHFAALSGMGLCYFCLKKNSEAIQAFEEALRINPGLDQIRTISEQLKQDTQMGEEV